MFSSGSFLVTAMMAFLITGPAATCDNRFADDDGSVFEQDITHIAAADITRGCNPPNNDQYCPNQPVTRGQMAAFLNRALNLTATSITDPFTDDDGSVFEQDITHIAAADITRGCNPPNNDQYCPNQPVTRGQMAAFLNRALNLTATSITDPFTDDDGSVFEQDITHIAAADITRGCNPPNNDQYCPNQPVTRGQMAALLNRGLDLTVPEPTAELESIEVVLGDVERLAADRGVTIVPISGGCRLGSLDRTDPEETILAPPGDLRFAYVAPDGTTTDVTWVQTPIAGRVVVEQSWRRAPSDPSTPLAAAWQQNPDLATLRDQAEGAPTLDVVSPIWWYVGADGTISSATITQYVADVHAMGKLIWPAIAGLDLDRNHALLSDPARRSAAARTISDQALAMGADGVNIDIEGFSEADADDFTDFVAEVADLVHAWGGVVSYDLVPRTDTWDVIPKELEYWSTAPQRRELAEVVDYTILMSYDQFNRYRPGGPVAAPWWVEDTLVYQLRYSDPHRVILGVPFYGRVWDPDDLSHPRALPLNRIEDLADTGVISWDYAYGLNRVELPDGRFLYLEDSALIADRLGLIEEYGLGGWAAWRLGFDSASLWEEIDRRTTPQSEPAVTH